MTQTTTKRRTRRRRRAVAFVSPLRGSWVLADDAAYADDCLTYRKEVIYPGHFVKMGPGENEPEIEFDVDEDTIEHWTATTNEMIANGIEVPLSIKHSDDPEKRCGTVLRFEKSFNPQRGVNSLYMIARFVDAEAAKLTRQAQVSLFSPPEYTDGRGRKYVRPIRHVALTDYPVVPGLGAFQSLAASLDDIFMSEDDDDEDPLDVVDNEDGDVATAKNNSDEEDELMSLAQISKKLGLKVPKNAGSLDHSNAILSAFKKREKRLAKLEQKMNGEEEDEEEDDDLEAADDEDDEEDDDLEAGDDDMDDEDDEDDDDLEAGDDDEDDEDDEDAEFSFSFDRPRRRARRRSRRRKSIKLSSSFVDRATRLRERDLEDLVNDGHVTPATARKLRKKFCSRKAVTLSLSHDDNVDGFQDVLSALRSNKAVELGEGTGHQGRQGERNALLADAERRREEFTSPNAM